MFEPLSPFGSSKVSSNTNTSRSVSLSILDSNSRQIAMNTDGNQTIEFRIPRDPSLFISSMTRENVTSIVINQTSLLLPHQLLFYLHYVNLTTSSSSSLPVSLHLRMRPLNASLAYLFIHKFDQSPQLNSSIQLIDGWTLLCPSQQSKDLHLSFENKEPFAFEMRQTKVWSSSISSTMTKHPIIGRWSSVCENWMTLNFIVIATTILRTLLSSDHRRSLTKDFISLLIMNFVFSPRVVIISTTVNNGKQMDFWFDHRYCLLNESRRCFDLCLGRIVDEWTRDTVFFQTFDDICRWFCCSSKTDQLELCLCQCRFPEEQNDVFDDHRCFSSLSDLVDLCPSSWQERSPESNLPSSFFLFRMIDLFI